MSNWYKETNDLCNKIAQDNDLQLWQVAGIIVTLSAQKEWELNVIQAKQVIQGKRITGLVSNHQLNQCREILSGRDPLTLWDKYSHKYRNFYACIINPYCTDSVCVDTHMINWYLETHPHSQLRTINYNRIFESPSRYKIIQDAIRRYAKVLGLIPMQYQAMIWLQRRANK